MSATSTAYVTTSSQGFGVFGTGSIYSNGQDFDSYDSTLGNWTSLGQRQNMDISSNGNINLPSVNMFGSAHAGPGMTLTRSGTITGSTANLSSSKTYANASAGAYATTNDNGSIASAYLNSTTRDLNIPAGGTLTVAGGNYYFNNVTLGSNASLTFTGPVTVYATGTFADNYAKISTFGNLPKNCNIQIIGSGAVTLNIKQHLYARVYAPQSDIHTDAIPSNQEFFGALLGNNLFLNANFHMDESLTTGAGGTAITVVQ
jgi:hypothetical protein